MMKVLIALLVGLETADGLITYSAIIKDLAWEANPVVQRVWGTGNFMLMKISGAILCALILWLLYKRFPMVSLTATSSIVAIYTAVLTWNLSVLFNFGLI